MNESDSSREAFSRRQAIRVAATAMTVASVMGLGGCASASQRRREKLGGQLGQPIATDPIVTSPRPSPIYTAPPASSGHTQTTAPRSSLEEIPGFVVARSKWTKGAPRGWLADPMNRINRITVHHDAISPVPSGSYTDSVRRLSAIRKGHLGNGWADIGYHYAIDPSGRVWEARPLGLQGAHVKDQNPNNIGVVMFGNYEKIQPTAQAMNALNRLLAHEMARFNIPLSRVFTHRELARTACPGRNLQAKMVRTRRSGGALASLIASGNYA